jgi:hypothetical protein
MSEKYVEFHRVSLLEIIISSNQKSVNQIPRFAALARVTHNLFTIFFGISSFKSALNFSRR